MIARLAGIPAIALFALPASAQDDCDEWNTRRFFHTATVETVAACLEAGADVNARSESAVPFGAEAGYTPLHFAALDSADPAVIALLLAAGAHVAARNRRGETPLHGAARLNHSVAVVEELVRAGADLDARDREGNTPLHASRLVGHPPVIHLLLELGADPTLVNDADEVADPVDCDHWNTPAFARIATAEATAACLAAGADANAWNENGDTPLLLATSHPGGGTPGAPASGNPAGLIELGADTGARDDSGNVANPLDCARFSTATFFHLASAQVVAGCIERGADVNARVADSLGEASPAPLHQASGWARDPAVVTLLLRAGAEVNATAGGATPLHQAARRADDPAIVTVLVEAGAELEVWTPGIHTPYGYTPLHSAVDRNRNPEVIAALIEAGADIHARQKDGPTPLHDARSPEAVALLLEAGADIEARATLRGWRYPNGGGMTPLHVAAKVGNAAVFMALLAAGADPDALDADGGTPMDYAGEQEALRELEVVKRRGEVPRR